MTNKLILKIAERVIWTFIEGACATLLLGQAFNISALEAAALGGLAAVISLVKNIAGTRIGGNPQSPAWLPASVTAAGDVVGDVTGTVVGEAGEVLGQVTGTVEGVLDGGEH